MRTCSIQSLNLYSESGKVHITTPSLCEGLGSKNCRLYSHENVACNFLRFGSGGKKFTRQNEKILVRVFPKTRTAIGPIPARFFHLVI